LNISGAGPRFGSTKLAVAMTMTMARRALILAVLSSLLLVAARPAHAQTESVLYTFCSLGAPQYCNDGAQPTGNLVLDSHGNLYGTTTWGGSEVAGGTVFKVTPSGTETVLHGFDGAGGGTDGYNPYFAGVVFDKAGNLYGTTDLGGADRAGTVFELSPTGTETVLHPFAFNSAGGTGPLAGVVLDKAGNLYGTTATGGTGNNGSGYGTVFKLTPAGTFTVLYSFTGGTDGCFPQNASLVLTGNGDLYGTTSGESCSSFGTVFKLTPTGTLKVLHSFVNDRTDGLDPKAGLVLKAGSLYGTTYFGGVNSNGTVFKVTLSGTETVLHSFTGSDGANPQASVILDAADNIYGTTYYGGAHSLGTVFMLTPTGTESVLHSFGGYPSDGAYPLTGVVLRKGILYGATYGGGSTRDGVVFKVVP
jgi:uncharacterized repeat protein (TIGR03803 family)